MADMTNPPPQPVNSWSHLLAALALAVVLALFILWPDRGPPVAEPAPASSTVAETTAPTETDS